MQKAYTTTQIRQLEKLSIETFGIAESELMERAGKAAFECLKLYWPESNNIFVLCGAGNNGGDGYVLARLAQQSGINVVVRYVGELEKLSTTAKQAHDLCQQAKVDIAPYSVEESLEAELIVDALLGIGLTGEVKGVYREVIERVNQTEYPVFSLDVPSGIDADTGAVLGDAILADVTMTFIGLKQGLLTGRAVTHCGELQLNSLDLTMEQHAQVDVSAEMIDGLSLPKLLPPRPKDSNKGDYGHVLVLGGNHGMGGAARMAGEAAARTGSGLTSVVMQSEYVGEVAAVRPELMCHTATSPKELKSLLDKATVLVIGAGLGQDKWAQMLFDAAMQTSLPMVIDADALYFASKQGIKSDSWILTPHPGEAARLLGCTTTEIQADRFSAAKAIVKQYGGVVVLKGAGTLVQSDEAGVAICAAGNPGMASGGMGDVLGGVIGGLLAQGLSLTDAARLGVWVHATAGDNVAAVQGERGLLATDLMAEIMLLINGSSLSVGYPQ
jgi:hydroxyethylthiazole kinase-like uncharacterized protein yjeF